MPFTISSQMPLTTQPPFLIFTINDLMLVCAFGRFAFFILEFWTIRMSVTFTDESETCWQKTPVANLMRHRQSGNYYARIRVGGKLIWKSSFGNALKPTGSAYLRPNAFAKYTSPKRGCSHLGLHDKKPLFCTVVAYQSIASRIAFQHFLMMSAPIILCATLATVLMATT